MCPDSPEAPADRAWLIRRMDQAGVALCVLSAIVGIFGWWVSQGGLRGRLIELDRSRPQTAAFRVDINRAEWPELAQLPGVGEILARRIVDSRQSEGPYIDHDDLRRVRGIGPKTVERVREYLRPMPGADNLVGR